MATGVPETYRIVDLVQWYKEKSLVINEDFQRRSVWTPTAKSYFVDTILRQLPIPMMYMRTKVDPRSQRAYREVVDGQQRLRSLVEFASNRLRLDKRAGEFAGMHYDDLDTELQERFLAYPITAMQLINANDDDVLEVFSRLNAYNLALNAAEQRHAKYQGDFKWAIRDASMHWSTLWEKYRVVSVRERVRMLDDSLMAEMFGVLLLGVTDGGQQRINKLYDRFDKGTWDQEGIVRQLNVVLGFTIDKLGDVIADNLARPPHFLMLFAAVSHALEGILPGDMGDQMPSRDPSMLSDLGMALSNLEKLDEVIGVDEPEREFKDFWLTSRGTTHRIASRKTRFPVYCRALLPTPL